MVVAGLLLLPCSRQDVLVFTAVYNRLDGPQAPLDSPVAVSDLTVGTMDLQHVLSCLAVDPGDLNSGSHT